MNPSESIEAAGPVSHEAFFLTSVIDYAILCITTKAQGEALRDIDANDHDFYAALQSAGRDYSIKNTLEVIAELQREHRWENVDAIDIPTVNERLAEKFQKGLIKKIE